MSYSDVMKWEPSPTGRGRRRSRDAKGNQEVGDFRFTNILELFSIYFFFSITLLYHSFSILFLPTTFTHTHTHDPHPRPTTSTHYPRPTTFSYTRLAPVVQWSRSCFHVQMNQVRLPAMLFSVSLYRFFFCLVFVF